MEISSKGSRAQMKERDKTMCVVNKEKRSPELATIAKGYSCRPGAHARRGALHVSAADMDTSLVATRASPPMSPSVRPPPLYKM